jgi:hypothetical protein
MFPQRICVCDETPARRVHALAHSTRAGSISIPVAFALNCLAAATTIRPSPQPRSRTRSPSFTCARCSIRRTVTRSVGCHKTSRVRFHPTHIIVIAPSAIPR